MAGGAFLASRCRRITMTTRAIDRERDLISSTSPTGSRSAAAIGTMPRVSLLSSLGAPLLQSHGARWPRSPCAARTRARTVCLDS
jgi:hypothetical protein